MFSEAHTYKLLAQSRQEARLCKQNLEAVSRTSSTPRVEFSFATLPRFPLEIIFDYLVNSLEGANSFALTERAVYYSALYGIDPNQLSKIPKVRVRRYSWLRTEPRALTDYHAALQRIARPEYSFRESIVFGFINRIARTLLCYLTPSLSGLNILDKLDKFHEIMGKDTIFSRVRHPTDFERGLDYAIHLANTLWGVGLTQEPTGFKKTQKILNIMLKNILSYNKSYEGKLEGRFAKRYRRFLGVVSILQKKHAKLQNIRENQSCVHSQFSYDGSRLENGPLLTIPPQIFCMINLRSVSIEGSLLVTLPPEIGLLTNLRELDLGSNELKSLPREIGALSNLRDLDLQHNRLKSLPSEIGALSNLIYLRLQHNKLQSLPSEIGNLKKLEVLTLFHNDLKALPMRMIELDSLEKLNINHTPLVPFFVPYLSYSLCCYTFYEDTPVLWWINRDVTRDILQHLATKSPKCFIRLDNRYNF